MINADTLSKMAELKREETLKSLASPAVARSDHAGLLSALSVFVRRGLAALRRPSPPASRPRTVSGKRGA